jgi:hypothetical protein
MQVPPILLEAMMQNSWRKISVYSTLYLQPTLRSWSGRQSHYCCEFGTEAVYCIVIRLRLTKFETFDPKVQEAEKGSIGKNKKQHKHKNGDLIDKKSVRIPILWPNP